MKKNKAMRLASVLLVLTLLTTCMTAGTFAKYTTGAEGEATARVAKFGVEVSVTPGNVFGKQYGADNVVVGNGDGGITVQTSTEDMVVAPGTKGEMTFSIKGTPETSVNLSIGLKKVPEDEKYKEVMLNENTTFKYQDGTQVEVQEKYMPVKWTLTKDKNSELSNTSLEKIEEYFSDNSKNYGVGELITGEYTLSWEWSIGDDETNKMDTLLGDLAAGKTITKGDADTTLVENTDYCLTEAFKLTISVTQVD